MPKNWRINLAKYVSYDRDANRSTCLLCEKSFNGRVLHNIKRHYALVHKHNFERGEVKEPPSKTKINLSQNEFLMCCVGLITVNAIPLTLFDDGQYFKRIIEPYENAFNIRVNSKSIRERLDSCAEQMKMNLSNLLKDKVLCVKFDIASRMDKSIMVINVQFSKNFQIHIFTIAMVELENRHTAPILNEEILKHFNTFGIKAVQIYSSTTDDGANVVKTSELLQESEITDADEYEEIHNRLSSVLTVERCAENTLQLVAQDVYKTVTAEVAECRETTNFLRQIIRNGTFAENIPMPTLDNFTRWSSTLEMLTSLLNLLEFVKMHKINCEINWDFIQNFVTAFKPVAECTKSLQTENYVIGDFYRDWLLCETKLETMPNNIFASALLQSMQLRNEIFWDNNAFVAALYIDPRFNYMDSPFFNESRRKQAVSHLISTSRTLTDLEGNTTFNGEPEVKQVELEFSPSPNDDFHLLEQKVNLLTQQSPQLPTNVQTIRRKLEGLSHKTRMPFRTNILDYWNELKSVEPDLAKLAEVVLSVPCTQTSVERAFSALSIILNKHNSNLKAENINNLLFIKLNEDLLSNVNFS